MSELSSYLEKADPTHHQLICTIDALVFRAAPDLESSLKWGNLTYHHWSNVCAIIAHATSVNLQVWGGANLDDPQQLLSGTGKGMRHVTFSGDPINSDAVVEIIRQAKAAALP